MYILAIDYVIVRDSVDKINEFLFHLILNWEIYSAAEQNSMKDRNNSTKIKHLNKYRAA